LQPARDAVAAWDRVNAAARGEVKTLRIAHTAGVATLVAVLDDYCVRHPDVQVQETLMSCYEQLAALAEHRLDVAAVARAARRPVPGLGGRPGPRRGQALIVVPQHRYSVPVG
jgi:DNA-binding transcriptional LysR family regulator